MPARRKRSWRGPQFIAVIIASISGVLVGSSLMAQDAATGSSNPSNLSAASDSLTVEQAQSRIAQLQSDRTLAAPQKQALISVYESIMSELRLKVESEKQTKEFALKAEAAPSATLEAKRLQENPPARDLISIDALRLYQLPALQSLLQSQQTNLQAAIDGRTKTEAAITAREASKKEIPRTIAEEKANLKKLTDRLASLPTIEAQDPLQREAELHLLRTQIASTAERIRKNEQELRVIEAEAELLPLRKANFLAEERYFASRVKEIVDELNKRRETKVEEERTIAEALVHETLASDSPTELKKMAERLRDRAKSWLELAKQNTALQLELEQAEEYLAFWTERHRIMTDRSRTHRSQLFRSINSWNGLLLRRHRNELPDVARLEKQLRDLVSRMQQTETTVIELEDWKNQDRDPQRYQSGLTALVPTELGRPMDGLVARADRLLANEQNLVANYITDANNYSDNLSKLADIKQATIDKVVEYRAFIDQQILWVRSAKPFSREDWLQLWPSVQYTLNYQRWLEAGKSLVADARAKLYQPFLFVALVVLLMINTSKMRRQTVSLGDQARRTTSMDFWPTLQTIAYCLLLSLPIPLVLFYVGYRFQHLEAKTSFTTSLGIACMVAARYFYPLEVLRQVCRTGGLAEMHFEWPMATTVKLRRHIRWFIDIGTPLAALTGFLFNLGDDDRFEHSLGRVSFAGLMLLSSMFFSIVLHPRSGVLADYLERHQGSWTERLRYLWYSFMVLGPLLLCANSLAGFHYTAIRLSMLCHTTLIVVVGLFLIHQIVERWLMLSRRRIMTDQARQRLQVAQLQDLEQIAKTSQLQRSLAPDLNAADYPDNYKTIDLAAINAQTLRFSVSILVVIGLLSLGYIWSGVLPAVNALNSITLWTVAGETPMQRTPITLADLLVSVPIIIFTYLAAKNLPGLLEIALLQRLPFDNASRYAIASLSRYAIMMLGIVVMFQTIGVRWESIQWLVAALGVGLGFGLQEIFANFVSGLILLFEQPIRIGDVITLGDTTGSVSRIRMRSTTITNWDRQELVVPNKDLVTGRLLNWTLSDTTNRLVLNIGITYGSDADKACRIIQKICDEHSNILDDPPTTVHLDNFGENSLNIAVRLFLARLDVRVDTQHEILLEIHRQFGEAGIMIALPQRDLHIRSLPEPWAVSRPPIFRKT